MVVIWLAIVCGFLRAEDPAVLPVQTNTQSPVRITAYVEEVWDWGDATVHAFRGGADLVHGETALSAQSIVVVDDSTAAGHRLLVYAEDSSSRAVRYQDADGVQNSAMRLIELQSRQAPETVSRQRSSIRQPNELMRRALERLYPERFPKTSTVSLQVGQELFVPPQQPSSGFQTPGSATRRIQVRPRSATPLQFQTFPSRDTIPEEQVYVITGGVNLLIDDVTLDVEGQTVRLGVIDLSADRIVIWTPAREADGLESGVSVVQPSGTRFQVYLEGNILIRQNANTVTATHAFFDATSDRALLLNAELRAQVPETGAEFRVKAERLRQLSADRFHAQNAWTTTSPYGKPGYRIQASDIFVEPGASTPWTWTNPTTGRVDVGQPTWITALNTKFMVGDVPLLYLPKVSGPAEDPNIPIRRAAVRHDRIFGYQIKTVWNLTKILGSNAPQGMQWDLLADYLSRRGPGVGTAARYNVATITGSILGDGTIYYQYDDGFDNLGLDRRKLAPADRNRGEITWKHRQRFADNASLFGEIGFLSDRNYLEQYHEIRFDEEKDVETILGVRKDNGAFSGTAWLQPSLYDFDTVTEWLPRADLYSFSQPVLGGLAYWSSHSSAGYAHLNPATPPTDLTDPFTALGMPYVRDAEGIVAMTRHRIDAPFMLGPININPYVMGEAAFWDEGLTAQDVDRYVVNAGAKAQISATKLMPFVRSDVFNLNGLAHKTENSVEYSFVDASRNLSEIAQYNQIDENAQERFRYRYTTQIFPGLIPAEFDPRFYAVRTGAGLWTSAPYHELVEDQQVIRLRSRNRLQTKVGPPDNPRIRDWMIWEAGLSYFLDPNQSNFGEDIGLLYGNYRWNVNDRTSLLTDGVFDLFENAQNYWNVGVLSQRSTRGSAYVSYRHVEAQNYFRSEILTASYSYQMSPKWVSTATYAYDVAESRSRGSSLTLSRVGLDFILHFGLGFDTSKNNVGVAVSLEPRFGPPSPTNLSYLLGLQGPY
ncbi:MAG: hypothetical protein R3C19_02435 [Planctomycetaceae bacterium]